jgi:hypothetical protein
MVYHGSIALWSIGGCQVALVDDLPAEREAGVVFRQLCHFPPNMEFRVFLSSVFMLCFYYLFNLDFSYVAIFYAVYIMH